MDRSSYFWALTLDQVVKQTSTHLETGLSDKEASQKNKAKQPLTSKSNLRGLKLFLKQFRSPVIYLLTGCALLSMILYDHSDAILITIILLASGILSFFQEYRASQALETLLSKIALQSSVFREGSIKTVKTSHVVEGDIVVLKAGDLIPGDCYLIEANHLFVDEASLTGESIYQEKSPGVLLETTPLSSRTNLLFMGTHVVSGEGKAIVVLIGKDSEFGKISKSIESTSKETNFEQGIRNIGAMLLKVTCLFLIGIFSLNLFLHRPFIESLLFSLALAIGLTPQLLPAIISINLARGAKKMAEHKVIVKRLSSIENFGSMTVLCFDKTGTLTEGTIELKQSLNIDSEHDENVLFFAYLNSFFQKGYENPIDKAILKSANFDLQVWKKLDEIPYDFIRKRITLLLQKDNETWIVAKGAFPEILTICDCNMTARALLEHQFCKYSEDGFRVICVAVKKVSNAIISEHNLTFTGFLLLSDLPKKGIQQTLQALSSLGIELKMITGDHLFAAKHIAKTLNFQGDTLLTGAMIAELSDVELQQKVQHCNVFAQIEPMQKEKIISSLRQSNHVVGFLGDGINDVSALHAADVSISVNNGVDAAKEIADMILLEKNLSSLKEAVLIGRTTFVNTLKYLFMATSANFGNMFSMAGSSLFLPFLPLLPHQILLTNLMEDCPEMAIAFDNVDEEMTKRPLKLNISFIKKFMIIFGLISSIFDTLTFGVLLFLKSRPQEFRTGWFIESVVSAAFIVLIIRTFRPFYQSKPNLLLLSSVFCIILITFFLPLLPFAEILGFTPLPLKFYIFIVCILVLYMTAVEYAKKRFQKQLKALYPQTNP